MEVRTVDPADAISLASFIAGMTTRDRTFLDERLLEPAAVEAWTVDPTAIGLVAIDGGQVAGLASVRKGGGWSSHVGELRVVVHATQRSRGLGTALVRRATEAAAASRLRKLVVDVMVTNRRAVALFESLGFESEATLRDHVRDGSGSYQDLVVLSAWLDADGNIVSTERVGDVVG